MRLDIHYSRTERGDETTSVNVYGAPSVSLLGASALVFGDGTGRTTVLVQLDKEGWRKLERIMADRAFESECADRERTGALS